MTRDTTPPTGNDEAPDPQPDQGAARRDPLRTSRTNGVWWAVVALAVVLVVLVVFIAQNTQRVQITFLGWEGRAPLAVSLMVATAGGLLIAVIAASLRMWQVRRRVRRGHA